MLAPGFRAASRRILQELESTHGTPVGPADAPPPPRDMATPGHSPAMMATPSAPRRTVSIGGRSAHASVFYLKHVVLHWRVEGGIIFTQRVNRPIPCWVFDDKTGDLES